MIVRHSSEFRFRLTERDRGAELNVYDLRTTAFFCGEKEGELGGAESVALR